MDRRTDRKKGRRTRQGRGDSGPSVERFRAAAVKEGRTRSGRWAGAGTCGGSATPAFRVAVDVVADGQRTPEIKWDDCVTTIVSHKLAERLGSPDVATALEAGPTANISKYFPALTILWVCSVN